MYHYVNTLNEKNLPLKVKMFNQTLIKPSNLTSCLQDTQDRNKLNHTTWKKPDNWKMHSRLQMTDLDSWRKNKVVGCQPGFDYGPK